MRQQAFGQTTVRQATIELLRGFGMTTVFGNPGSTELPMFRDFPDDFRYVLGLQESVVLGMADGFAQATGNAALVNLHSAAGVGHALGNLFTAFKNQTPLVVTAGQQARSILPYEPFLFAERATEFPRPYVKWASEPARAEDVPQAIARAYYVAMQRPRGPTFVSVPVDDWDQRCDPVGSRRVGDGTGAGEPGLIADLAAALASAGRPALVLGAGAARDGAWDAAVALAERHGAAVWVAPFSARASFPEDHGLFAGFLAPMRERIVADLAPYDLIVVAGGPLSLYHVEGEGPHVPEGAKVFLLTDNPAVATWAPDGTAIIADIQAAFTALLAEPCPRQRQWPPARASVSALDGASLTDAYLLQRIAALRPERSVIVEEAPSSRGPMHDHLPILREHGFYTGASGGLGHGLPAAIGIALGRPGEKVIALLGDGSAMYAIQGLWSAVQLGLPISFVIVKNRRYEALVSFGHHFGLQKTWGTALPDMDFCAIAAGQGMPSRNVATAALLDEALATSFVAAGPTLVEVEVA